RRWLARDLERPVPVLVVGPSPTEAPDSSLVHMCDAFVRTFGSTDSAWLVENGVVDLGTFDERAVYAEARSEPMLVLGTSFAFVHLLDALGDASMRLPPGSRVMQTGGYKGKSREVPKAELVRDLARAFAIEPRAIVAEYGMAELSSQFYERTLFEPSARAGVFAEPPWARVVPVDPETAKPVAPGEIGIARIVDLMNVDSAVAVLTQDRVRRVDEASFELLGRAEGAPPRGCSIAIDEILGSAAS
ncbi:MAG TPA: acyl-protein synthetase, partial [Labilithrix sp.]